MNILLFVHLVIALLLIAVILLQQTGSDGLSGIGGGSGGGNGVISARSAATFLSRTTAVLAALFMINSLILANISTSKVKPESTIEAIEKEESQKNAVPIAK